MRRRVLRRPARLAGVVIALAAVVFFAPALFSGKVLAGDDLLLVEAPQASAKPADFGELSNTFTYDSAYVFHPDLIEARRQVRAGRLPAWTHHIGGGRSLLASQQTAPFYPANGLAYVMDFWTSLEWTALLKLLVAGLGMAFLLRVLGRSWPAATFGGVAYMLSTHLAGWMAHPHSNIYVLGPVMAAFAIRVARGPRVGDAAALAATVGLAVLGGHQQSVLVVGAFIVAPLALAYALREPDVGWRPPRVIVGRVGLLVAAVLVGVLAGALMVLPFAEALEQSAGNADRGSVGLPRSALNTLVFPELWGHPLKFELDGAPSVFQERVLYFGVIPLLLAIGSVVARRPTQAQSVLIATGLLAGAATFIRPVGDVLLELPGFSATTIRLQIVIAFAGTALAAYAIDTLLTGTRSERIRLAVAVLVVGLLVPLQWLVRHDEVYGQLGEALKHFPALDDRVPDGNAVRFGEVLGFLIWALVAAAAAWLAVVRPSSALGLVAVLLVAVAIDATAVGRYIPMVDRDRVDVAEGRTLQFFQQRGAAGERVGGDLNLFGPNLANRWPANDARSHALPTVERYKQLWLKLGGVGSGSNLQRAQWGLSREVPDLLDIFSVRWILSFDLETKTPRTYRRTTADVEWPVWENLDAHARARFVSSWDTAPDEQQALAQVADGGARRVGDTPVIEGVREPAGSGSAEAVPARIVRDEDTQTRVEVNAPQDGYLVLNDVYYPGWKAKVDGRDAEIRPANVAFRAVAVPAGQHTVTFEYESAAVRWGVILSVVAWLAIVAALVLSLRRVPLRRRAAV